MPPEPQTKRTIAFFDGQNLFHAAREAFGCTYPNYDPIALARAVCAARGWVLSQARFYTGVPDSTDNPFWSHFWAGKLLTMSRQGIEVYSRSLRYRNRRVALPDRSEHTYLAADEKGIDIRIALDVLRLAHRQHYDVALIFSQDQDFSEVAEEIRVIAREQRRWIKIACAFPLSPTSRNRRGIEKTDWLPIDRATYDTCLDPRDYRQKKPTEGEGR
jgi:uncharacterized LabA/DUF88 family protein